MDQWLTSLPKILCKWIYIIYTNLSNAIFSTSSRYFANRESCILLLSLLLKKPGLHVNNVIMFEKFVEMCTVMWLLLITFFKFLQIFHAYIDTTAYKTVLVLGSNHFKKTVKWRKIMIAWIFDLPYQNNGEMPLRSSKEYGFFTYKLVQELQVIMIRCIFTFDIDQNIWKKTS